MSMAYSSFLTAMLQQPLEVLESWVSEGTGRDAQHSGLVGQPYSPLKNLPLQPFNHSRLHLTLQGIHP